jgi:hypothetical protein
MAAVLSLAKSNRSLAEGIAGFPNRLQRAEQYATPEEKKCLAESQARRAGFRQANSLPRVYLMATAQQKKQKQNWNRHPKKPQ